MVRNVPTYMRHKRDVTTMSHSGWVALCFSCIHEAKTSNNLLKDFSAIFLCTIYLCSLQFSQQQANLKIHLLTKTCLDLLKFDPNMFSIDHISFCQTNKVFLTFIKIIDNITISYDWLTF